MNTVQMELPGNALQARFEFLVRSTQLPVILEEQAWEVPLAALDRLLRCELLELGRRCCPSDFVDVHASIIDELDRLRVFCTLPQVGGKWMVGFGGAFSAGKSSLINRLMDEPLLPVQITPTTSMPTYVLKGGADAITALNMRGAPIELSNDEFESLTHDEMLLHGTQIASLLRSAHVMREHFPWDNLIFADTPGYSKAAGAADIASDSETARKQLDAAQSVVWVVNAESGSLTESDLHFLTSLRRDIPRIVVVTRADRKSPAEIDDIVTLIRSMLAERDISVLDVIPVGRGRNAAIYPMQSLLGLFEQWNASAPSLPCSLNIRRALRRLARHAEFELGVAEQRLIATNLAIAAANDAVAEALEPINRSARQHIDVCTAFSEELRELEARIFTEIERIGDATGMSMDRPSPINTVWEVISPVKSNVADLFKSNSWTATTARFDDALELLASRIDAIDVARVIRRKRKHDSSLSTMFEATTDIGDVVRKTLGRNASFFENNPQ
jgi:hypothetical protein